MPYAYVMKIENGTAIGLPLPRPATVALESGHNVGCAHWSDEDLTTIAGLGPVQPWDDATHRSSVNFIWEKMRPEPVYRDSKPDPGRGR